MTRKKIIPAIIFLPVLAIIIAFGFLVIGKVKKVSQFIKPIIKSNDVAVVVTPAPSTSPTPSPTPKPLTFAEMNSLYGPCTYLPTLMYHHVQTEEAAKAKKQTALTVLTSDFMKQMQYLKDKGYTTISMQDLIDFFNTRAPISSKSVLLTFDDGYEDFATDAYPILSQFGFKATMFLPTGLMNNPDYLTWDQINQINSEGRILFANHTWSHRNVKSTNDVMEREISTADTQLNEKGLDNPKVFAYPYGIESAQAISYLTSLNYQVAFTTQYGTALCKQKRLELPRVRIGNSNLNSYGF